MSQETTTRHSVGSYRPPSHPDPADTPLTPRSLSTWVPIISALVAIAVSWGIVTTRLDGKLGATEYQKDQTELVRQLGELRGDIRVIRAAVCAKTPEVCR